MERQQLAGSGPAGSRRSPWIPANSSSENGAPAACWQRAGWKPALPLDSSQQLINPVNLVNPVYRFIIGRTPQRGSVVLNEAGQVFTAIC